MPSAPRTARALARAELTRAILDRASVQLAEVGPAALSVRQIARDLEMASSAVYRYFPSRDALLTALLDPRPSTTSARRSRTATPAPTATTCAAAGSASRTGSGAGRSRTRTSTPSPTAHRSPATPHPRTPSPRRTRVSRALLALVRDAQDAGRSPAAPTRPADEGGAGLDRAGPHASSAAELDEAYAVRGLMAWATLFGHVSLELFGHMYRGRPRLRGALRRRWSSSSPTTSGS